MFTEMENTTKLEQFGQKIITLTSFLLFPVTLFYLSPALIVEGTAQGIITGSFILFSLLFLSGLFFGRRFCGWICPTSWLQDTLIKYKNRRRNRAYGKKCSCKIHPSCLLS